MDQPTGRSFSFAVVRISGLPFLTQQMLQSAGRYSKPSGTVFFAHVTFSYYDKQYANLTLQEFIARKMYWRDGDS